jgi:hypothetical protein
VVGTIREVRILRHGFPRADTDLELTAALGEQ